MMSRPALILIAAAMTLSSCVTETPVCESPDARSIVEALAAEDLLVPSLMQMMPNTAAELDSRGQDTSGFVDRFENGVKGVMAGFEGENAEEVMIAAWSKVDPATRAAMCDAINGDDREAIMKVNAQLAPILGPDAMSIVEAAGEDLLRVLETNPQE